MVNNVLDNTNHTYSILSYAVYENVLNNKEENYTIESYKNMITAKERLKDAIELGKDPLHNGIEE